MDLISGRPNTTTTTNPKVSMARLYCIHCVLLGPNSKRTQTKSLTTWSRCEITLDCAIRLISSTSPSVQAASRLLAQRFWSLLRKASILETPQAFIPIYSSLWIINSKQQKTNYKELSILKAQILPHDLYYEYDIFGTRENQSWKSKEAKLITGTITTAIIMTMSSIHKEVL